MVVERLCCAREVTPIIDVCSAMEADTDMTGARGQVIRTPRYTACFEVETGEEIPRATRLVINQPTLWCGFRGSLQKNLCWQTVLHCNCLDSPTEVAVNTSKIGIDEIHHLAVCKQIVGKCEDHTIRRLVAFSQQAQFVIKKRDRQFKTITAKPRFSHLA